MRTHSIVGNLWANTVRQRSNFVTHLRSEARPVEPHEVVDAPSPTSASCLRSAGLETCEAAQSLYESCAHIRVLWKAREVSWIDHLNDSYAIQD